jgi:hypothetical protein
MLHRGWDRRATVFLTFALLSVISTNLSPAQVFDLEQDRVPMAELNGLMRFHTGDHPRWSDPNLDDSQWPLIRSGQPWSQQGYQNYSGVAWYRFRVVLPREHRQLALYFGEVSTSYEVYADGRLVGQFGGIPPHEKVVIAIPKVFLLPMSITNFEHSLLIAVRVWKRPRAAMYSVGGFTLPPCIGDADLIQDWRSRIVDRLLWNDSAANYQAFIEFLAGVAGLLLFSLRRQERAYLWFGAYQLFGAASLFTVTYIDFHELTSNLYLVLLNLFQTGAEACFVAFIFHIVGGRRGKLYWIAIGIAVFGYLLLVPELREWISFSTFQVMNTIASIPYTAIIMILIYGGIRRGARDAKLLLLPVGLYNLSELIDISHEAIFTSGNTGIEKYLGWTEQLSRWPFPISLMDATNALMQISMLAILILRFARSRRDEERFKSELEAARTVQQVLIPEEIPAIPGLALECVYKPAGQVGGDFFQILPTPNNGALVVIGDVSGKGMPAAMAVSLLVGTVRTLAHYTQSPSEILTAMNQRILGRSKNGFTTCLVLRLDPDGAATVANAGHLAPYNGSKELTVESGLPLGLAAEAEYTESTFHLDPGEELTLVTDGVPEARAKNGELFGFERTASIAILSAAHIAATAVAFGQQDDVTVLKIRRQPLPGFTSASDDASALSPTTA